MHDVTTIINHFLIFFGGILIGTIGLLVVFAVYLLKVEIRECLGNGNIVKTSNGHKYYIRKPVSLSESVNVLCSFIFLRVFSENKQSIKESSKRGIIIFLSLVVIFLVVLLFALATILYK